MNNNTSALCIALGMRTLFGPFAAVAGQDTSRYSGPIIDMHMHARVRMARGPGGEPLPRPCEPAHYEQSPAVAREDGDVLCLTLEAMDRYNIVLAFLSDDVDNVEQWVAAAPRRFLPLPGVVNPADVDPP